MILSRQTCLSLMVVGLLLLGLACQFFAPPAPSPAATLTVSVDELVFSEPQTGQRFRALDACFRAVTAEGWRSMGYRRYPNSYQALWCRGAGARQDCGIASGTAHNRDQQVLYLQTYYYSFPEVFGLGVAGLLVPPADGWGVSFSLSEGGGKLYDDGISLALFRYEQGGDEPADTVLVIGPFSYQSFQTDLVEREIVGPEILGLSAREKLALVLSSPEAMREMSIQYHQSLAERVEASLLAPDFLACDRAEYKEGGVQPACLPRPLTEAERSAELTRAAAYFASQEDLLREHYQEMYAAILTSFPFERCWQP